MRCSSVSPRCWSWTVRCASASPPRLAYPVVVGCAAIALILFLVGNIVPAFAGLFAEMHVALPLSTKILIAVGMMLRSPAAVGGLIAGVLFVLAGIRYASAHPWFARVLDRMMLALPVTGPLTSKVIAARLSRTLGTLVRSGVGLLDALNACEDVVGSPLYAESVASVAAALREGHPMTVPLERAKLFDPIFLQLVRVGEETGTLDVMLLRIAEYFELDVESAVAALGSIVEPVLIIVLGTVVGTIVASVLIPLYSVIGGIK